MGLSEGGEHIYPRELEDLLFAHPDVGEVAVVGLPDERWGETIAAFIRPAPGHTIDKAELFSYMRDHLAPHKTPKQWFEVDAFPLTGSRERSRSTSCATSGWSVKSPNCERVTGSLIEALTLRFGRRHHLP